MFGVPALYTPMPALRERVVGGRDVVGSLPYEFGRIARHPGADWKVREVMAGQRRHEMFEKGNEAINLQVYKQIRRMEFDKTSDMKAMVGRVRHGVAMGLQGVQRDLDRRRHKLRNLILQEESAYGREYVDKAQRADENKMEEHRQEAATIRARMEGSRKALAAEKRLQQYKQRCTELREQVAQRNLVAIKEGNLQQMAEREWMNEQAREEDRMWFAVMMKNIEALKKAEDDNLQRRKQRTQDMVAIQLQQQEGRRQLERERDLVRQEEMRGNERALAELKEEQRQEAIEYDKKIEITRNDLLDQLRQREELMERRNREQQLMEQAMHKLSEAEFRREKESLQDLTEVRKRESKLYRENLAELRVERAKADKDLEDVLAEETRKADRRRDATRAKIKEARLKLQKEVQFGLQQQVEHKRAVRLSEQKKLQDEHELGAQLWEQQRRLSELHNNQKKESRRQYRLDLDQQLAYNKLLKERERAEQEREYSELLQEEERYKRMVDTLRTSPQEIREMHPFMAVMQGDAAPSPPPDLLQPPAPRLTFPCPQFAGADPTPPLPMPAPVTLKRPQGNGAVEKSTPPHNGLDKPEATCPPPPPAGNIHAPTAAVIALPCSALTRGAKPAARRVEMPCYIKHLNYAAT